jgi:hypothetical protein
VQLPHFCILGWHNANSDLSRLAQVRTVERNRGQWPTPQSPSSFFSWAQSCPESAQSARYLPFLKLILDVGLKLSE